MESRFGCDFSQVKVHADSQAAEPSSLFAATGRGLEAAPAPRASPACRSKIKAEPSDRKGPDIVAEETEEGPPGVEPGDKEESPQTSGQAASAAEPQAEVLAKSRHKEKIEFEVVRAELPSLTEALCKAKCPAPRNAPINFGIRRSTAAQIGAMSACTWGITSPDPLQVSTTTCRDGATWRLRATRVRSIIRTFSRQLAGQREPTIGNSTSANFCQQVTELDSLGSCLGSWYMLAAVRAHEAVHATEWRTSMGSDWPAQKAIIEGLSVPASGATKSRGSATNAMRTSAAFNSALQTSNASGNYPAFWGIPDPNAQTDAAERVIVTPRIREICVHARNRGWAPGGCPICAGLGIT
jgi:hypothetical protein